MEQIMKADHVYEKPACLAVLSRAAINLFQGDIAGCLSNGLKLEEELNHLPGQGALLTTTQIMLAQCYFTKKSYEKALEYYRKCFVRNKWLDLKPRLGMAYCYFYLNRF
jgi:tetratricopeptide (TPR) repeat protein